MLRILLSAVCLSALFISPARAQKLDLDALPDHLKRDLGFLGGRAAPFRDPLRD